VKVLYVIEMNDLKDLLFKSSGGPVSCNRSLRFFKLPPKAYTGTCSAENPFFLSDHAIAPRCKGFYRERALDIVNSCARKVHTLISSHVCLRSMPPTSRHGTIQTLSTQLRLQGCVLWKFETLERSAWLDFRVRASGLGFGGE